MDDFTIALVQLRDYGGETSAAINFIRDAVRRTEEPPDAILLPELWISGEASVTALEEIKRLCAEEGFFAVTGGMIWKTGESRVIRSWAADDLGRTAAFYDKAHLYSAGGEKDFAAGDSPSIFNIGGAVCSAVSGYDALFPEFLRQISMAGARIFFVSAAWPRALAPQWEFTLRSFAFANQSFVIACNRAGPAGENFFPGHSAAVAPSGEIIASMGEAEDFVTVSLKVSETAKWRKKLPLERDRRGDIYRIIC
jgi:predicted amidohydrolase